MRSWTCSRVTCPYRPGSRVPSRFRFGPLSSSRWATVDIGEKTVASLAPFAANWRQRASIGSQRRPRSGEIRGPGESSEGGETRLDGAPRLLHSVRAGIETLDRAEDYV